MPSGVVALLDAVATAKIESIWQEFRATFGVHGVSRTPIAHFSFHAAESYDVFKTIATMNSIAKTMPPFKARIGGLGIFTGDTPVVYLPVVRTEGLSLIHAQVWQQSTAAATNPLNYYHPDYWQPHITIAHDDIVPEKLPQVTAMLQARQFDWEFEIPQFGFIFEREAGQVKELLAEFPLKG
jgi:2'-5' RNA ligase